MKDSFWCFWFGFMIAGVLGIVSLQCYKHTLYLKGSDGCGNNREKLFDKGFQIIEEKENENV